MDALRKMHHNIIVITLDWRHHLFRCIMRSWYALVSIKISFYVIIYANMWKKFLNNLGSLVLFSSHNNVKFIFIYTEQKPLSCRIRIDFDLLNWNKRLISIKIFQSLYFRTKILYYIHKKLGSGIKKKDNYKTNPVKCVWLGTWKKIFNWWKYFKCWKGPEARATLRPLQCCSYNWGFLLFRCMLPKILDAAAVKIPLRCSTVFG